MTAPDHADEKTPITRARLLMAAGAMAGIQVCYAAQINHGSASLLSLGLDESRVSLAWLAGPLSGLIVQPLVGIASDSCTSRLGKRRPFLIAGTAFTTAALLLFSNAKFIGEAFMGAGTNSALHVALAIAIFAFFLLDFSIQAIQAPLRALITDIAPGDLLPVGNVYIALFTGLGNLMGSFLASRRLTTIMPFFLSDTQALFAIASVLLIVSVTICVLTAHEIPMSISDQSAVEDIAAIPPIDRMGSVSSLNALDPSSSVASINNDFGIGPPMIPPTPPGRLRRAYRLERARGGSISVVPQSSSSIFRVSSSPSMWSLGLGPSASMPSLRDAQHSRGLRSSGSHAALLGNREPSFVSGWRHRTSTQYGYSMLRDAPRPFWRVFAVQLFTWFGFFSLFVFVNPWVGTNVFLGRGAAPEGSVQREHFEAGVRLGGIGNTLTALVTVLYSPLITTLLARFGILRTYIFSQFVEAICLISAHFIRGIPGQKEPSSWLKLATILDIGSFGIVWATTMGVPWAIIGKALNDDPEYQPRIGLFTTVFNVSQSFPQLFVSFGSPLILEQFNNDVSAVMFIGGLLALVGAGLVYLLRVDIFADGNSGGFGESQIPDDSQSRTNIDMTQPALSTDVLTAPSAVANSEYHHGHASRDDSTLKEPFLQEK